MSSKPPKTVAAYIARAPPSHRPALRKLRADILAAAPEAEEVISYQMAGYRQGRMLGYFGDFKGHITFFFLSRAARKKYARQLAKYESVTSGAGIKFDPARPLPSTLVKGLVRARVAEERARERSKRKPKPKPSARSRRR